MKKIIVANWKMKLSYLHSLALAKKYQSSRQIRGSVRDIIVCPDFISASKVAEILKQKPFSSGAQDCAMAARGAYTGEVSPADIKAIGMNYVILGHSERRDQLHENSALIAAKVKAAISEGLVPIICIGEKLIEKQSGETRKYLRSELKKSLAGVKLKPQDRLIIAYEPVWAISSTRGAKSMDPEEADAIQEFIKGLAVKILKKKVPVLYGGSVSSDNALAYLKMKNIDGLLVGAASLDVADFEKMC